MPSDEDNARLMWALLSQKTEKGKLTGIDWEKVAADMGIAKSHTAYCRWDALYKNLQAKNLPGTSPLKGVAAAKAAKSRTTTPKKTKTANPKARSAVTKARGSTKTKKAEKDVDEPESMEEYDALEQDQNRNGVTIKVENARAKVSDAQDALQEDEVDSTHEDVFYEALESPEEVIEG